MDQDFWHRRWAKNEINFHEAEANRLLVSHVDAMALRAKARIFLPLCGKTNDIAWLRGRGFSVVGAELSEQAIIQLFAENGWEPRIEQRDGFKLCQADGVEIFVGDIFALTPQLLGPVDAVYDRAALVALPAEMRGRYAQHLAQLTRHAQQLLIVFEYDQEKMKGPPFSVNRDEVFRQYSGRYDVTMLASETVPNKLKGQIEALENAYLLRARHNTR
jgi:thiopurine S-methyltransferase